MQRILVIGGGFAGVWSAAAAVRLARLQGAGSVSVAMVTPGDDLVIRPRLYQAEPETMRVSLDRILGPIGVRRIAATVTGIDTDRRSVSTIHRDGEPRELGYDRLVLAAGSRLVRPTLPGAELLHDVDTMPAAAALDNHLRLLAERPEGAGRFTAVVIGAGFTGLEVATELVERLEKIAREAGVPDRVRVVLIERSEQVGAALGPGPYQQVADALNRLGIEQRAGVGVTAIEPDQVVLSDGSRIETHTAIWTAGMQASPLTAEIPGTHDRLGRLTVDENLRVVGVPHVYAAGDVAAAGAEPGHSVLQSCQHASPLGKYAGHNVAADLLGVAPVPYTADPYVTCLDLGAAGAVFTKGWDRTVVASGEQAKTRKRAVNEVWIYPPTNPEELLRRADYRVPQRQPIPGLG